MCEAHECSSQTQTTTISSIRVIQIKSLNLSIVNVHGKVHFPKDEEQCNWVPTLWLCQGRDEGMRPEVESNELHLLALL